METTRDPRPQSLTLCALYALSGLIALGYQVTWFRIFVDRFGSTNLTFLVVLGGFIGGLGVGATASARLSARLAADLRIRDRLRLYGAFELLIALLAGLTIVSGWIPAGGWGSFPYELEGALHRHHPLYQVSRAAIVLLCVFLPCVLMGVTFPLLCSTFPQDPRLPSRLYAWNTLGACSGVILLHFLLLPSIGHERAFLAMMALNVVLGLVFLARGGDPDPGRVEQPAGDAPPAGGTSAGVLLTAAALTGFVAGGLEGDMFKRVAFLGGNSSAGMSFVSFWAILGIFVASFIVQRARNLSLGHLKAAFVLGAVAYSATWRYIFDIRHWLEQQTLDAAFLQLPALVREQVPLQFPASLGQILLIVGVIVFPTYFLISLFFPYVCNSLHAGSAHLGLACGLNTLAFCAGLLLFTWLAPSVNVFYSMRLMPLYFVICAAAVVLLPARGALPRWHPALLLIALIGAPFVVSQDIDRSSLRPGHPARSSPVHTIRSNGADTTYVVALPQGAHLYFNAHPMSGTNAGAAQYMRLMAHFPLLCHPSPADALLIGFGCGNTCSAIASHPTIERLDVVDLNARVIETAPAFALANRRVYLDRRLRFVIDDGRNFLNITDRRYDLITSEPPPPMMPGTYRLYSEEYYRAVLGRLTPQGMMTQWLPLDQMPPAAVAVATRTFLSVFPHTLLFTGFRDQLVIIGSPSPIDLSIAERRFGTLPAVKQDLERIEIFAFVDLLARTLASDAQLRRELGSGPVVSDRRNDLEHMFCEPANPAFATYDPGGWLSDPAFRKLACAQELGAIVRHPGRLLYRVPDFPPLSLLRSPIAAAPGTDWARVLGLLTPISTALGERRLDRACALYQEALAQTGELPAARLGLAAALIAQGRPDQALPHLDALDRIEPGDLHSAALRADARRAASPPPK